ncbi:guanylate kinase [Clostridium oryzae]|uniref:Guanylate kinase n=1 Tax=Clostridium oryzae TaxID=1450648 RepID=A0A1V4IIK7_9CLOT|nr:guanylate kinase [Clostridium oryzae]OPJ59783.1 guanylate kinase [Clostridium oryzae]
MDTIICFVGESGSGKSTIAELLEKEGYNYIQSYTTRPKRSENEKGHIFVHDDKLLRRKEALSREELSADIIAYTFFDRYHYWATRQQYKNKGISIYVVDVAGIKELRSTVKDAAITTIYLNTDFNIRARRMYARKHHMNIDELERHAIVEDEDILRRLQHDSEAFRIVPCDYAVDCNRAIDDVIKDVKAILENM